MAESAPQLPEDDIEAAAQQPVQDENALADGDRSSQSNGYNELTYEQRLYGFVEDTRLQVNRTFLDFQDLSRMHIVHLTNELAKYDQAMEKDKAAPQDIEHIGDLLHRYTTAIHDREYRSRFPKYGGAVTKFIYTLWHRAFPSTYRDGGVLMVHYSDESPKATDPLRSLLKRVLPSNLTWTGEEMARDSGSEYRMGETPEDVSPFVDGLARFIVAITGGLSLVVPMLVMRLGETLPKSLTTVSVAVILFSALTSLMFRASNVETLAATAAYAAVLVVFVGTSS